MFGLRQTPNLREKNSPGITCCLIYLLHLPKQSAVIAQCVIRSHVSEASHSALASSQHSLKYLVILSASKML